MEQKEPKWKVLLIGGPSGIGKTYLTKKLSTHYGCPYIRIDHLRFFMKEILKNDGEQSASLFDETESISDNNYQKLAQFMKPGINGLISKFTHHKETPAMIIEGIEILPDVLELEQTDTIKGIFIYDELDTIKQRLLSRKRSYVNEVNVDELAKKHFELGQGIKEQAISKGFYTIQATPEETIVDRAIKLLK